MEKSGHAPCITHFLALDQINHLKIVTYIVQGIISLIFLYHVNVIIFVTAL